MAERSKALVLGTSLLGGVGSNPTPIKATLRGFLFGLNILIFNLCFLYGRTKKRKVIASARISSELAQRKSVGLITQRSQDRNLDSLMSRLAQLVERKTLNLVVVGSSPTVGVPFLFFGILIFFKKIPKKSFPHRESNPGRVGENHIS